MSESETHSDLARHRREVVLGVRRCKSVMAGCDAHGVPRATYYRWARRYSRRGLAGLEDGDRTPRRQPAKTPRPTIKRLHELSDRAPADGCWTLSDQLRREGLSISGPTVQKYLRAGGRRTWRERVRRIEAKLEKEGWKPTRRQQRHIERINPAIRQLHERAVHPGTLLYQDRWSFKDIGSYKEILVHVVMDAASGMTWMAPQRVGVPKRHIKILDKQVFPFFDQHGWDIGTIKTDDAPTYFSHPFEYHRRLAMRRIKHPRSWRQSIWDNGMFMVMRQRFCSEFLPGVTGKQGPKYIRALTLKMERWLMDFNASPWEGYPLFGRSPHEVIAEAIGHPIVKGERFRLVT